jgi:hypothetical protein
MQLDLAEELVREQTALGVEHGNRAFVAGGFDGEYSHDGEFQRCFAFYRTAALESRPLPRMGAAKIPVNSTTLRFYAERSRT